MGKYEGWVIFLYFYPGSKRIIFVTRMGFSCFYILSQFLYPFFSKFHLLQFDFLGIFLVTCPLILFFFPRDYIVFLLFSFYFSFILYFLFFSFVIVVFPSQPEKNIPFSMVIYKDNENKIYFICDLCFFFFVIFFVVCGLFFICDFLCV